ncbi:hypothetical protein [Acidithrix sp. C25]|uniref:hypothetical protein n=1 Tax=Acidithrix sp. C25 TaxID=1671482 RepID=UPI000AC778C4|nr:hypothetical protein [Acidithrix sp. C25]CAG4928135.1 unnamed protein product [Acidithrix sp. C25]
MFVETDLNADGTDGTDVSPQNSAEPPSEGRSSSFERILTYFIVASTVVFLIWQYHPSLLFSNTTTTGGDTGAHFSVPYFYIHHILNHFRLTGWSSSWYAGYPLYVFYFPLPGIITAILSFILPYGVAFKLTTAIGPLTLPIAIYYFARSMKVGYLLSGLTSIMAVAYLFDRSFTIDGGNIASTLAGEYSFAISLSLCFFAVAVLLVDPGSTKRRVASGILLSATLLAHIIPAAFAVAILIFLAVIRRKRNLVLGATISILIMIGLSAIWEIPLIVNYSFSTSMGWSRITTYAVSLFPSELRVYIALAVIGFVASLFLKIEIGGLFGTVAVTSAIAFVFFPLKAVYNGRVLPFYVLAIYILAAIGVYVIVELLAALFGWRKTIFLQLLPGVRSSIGSSIGLQIPTAARYGAPTGSQDSSGGILSDYIAPAQSMARATAKAQVASIRRALYVLSSVSILAVVLLQLVGSPPWFPIKVTPSFVPSWIKWNYTGYEAKVGFSEYRALMLEMKSVGAKYGCGRAMWEYNSNQNDFGTPMALMLLPYWTNNCIDSMEGLFFESSATTPYHFLNQSELSAAPSEAMAGLPYSGINVGLGVQHLQLLGVRYYMAFSPALKIAANENPNLKLIATLPAISPTSTTPVLTETWNIYEVSHSQIVTPLTQAPVVMTGVTNAQSSWLPPALLYYQNPSEYSVVRLASGPAGLLRVPANKTVTKTSPLPSVVVSNLKVTNSTVSFNVSRTGVPVIIKESYFPNFKVSGGLGPYRAAPNEMVVYPTSSHVTVSYQNSAADNLGTIISLITLVLALIAVERKRILAIFRS